MHVIFTHTDTLLEGLWRQNIDSYCAYEPNGPEGTYQMQQMLLISPSAQVEFLVQSLLRINVEVTDGFDDQKKYMESMEGNIEKLDHKVIDLGVAIAKTSRFDTKIQNDSEAVLIKVSDNCSKIENLMHAGLKATQAVAEKAKRAEPDNTAKDIDDNKKPSKKKNKDNLGSPNTPVEDDTFRQHQVTWIGTSISKVLDKTKFEKDAEVKVRAVKAYCVNEEGRFPKSNFKAIVPEVVSKGQTDTLILETGSIEITTIDVNKALMDPRKDINKYKKEWFAKAEEVSTELFKLAEDAVANDDKLHVVILKRLPRFDRSANEKENCKN